MRISVCDQARKLALALIALLAFLATTSVSDAQKQTLSGQVPSLQDFLIQYIGAPDSQQDRDNTRYLLATADLNGDGHPETIVYILSPGLCGSGGCTMLILALENSQYKVLAETSITRLPIRLLFTKTNGWNDVGVFVAGGGIHRGYEAKLAFDGKEYPGNPTVPPARKLPSGAPGTILIAADTESHAKRVYR